MYWLDGGGVAQVTLWYRDVTFASLVPTIFSDRGYLYYGIRHRCCFDAFVSTRIDMVQCYFGEDGAGKMLWARAEGMTILAHDALAIVVLPILTVDRRRNCRDLP